MKFWCPRSLGFMSLVALVVTACTGTSPALPTPTQVDLALLRTAAAASYAAEQTLRAPTETFTPQATPTPEPTSTPTETPTPTAAATGTVNWTMLPVLDGIKEYIGYYLVNPIESVTDCQYNSIPFLAYPLIKRTGDYEADIKTALKVLFGFNSASYDRFANPSYKSNLQVSGYFIDGITLNISLSGSLHHYFVYATGFEFSKFCPDSQTRDQIVKTVWQFRDLLAASGISDVVIWYYNDLLDDLLLNDFPAHP